MNKDYSNYTNNTILSIYQILLLGKYFVMRKKNHILPESDEQPLTLQISSNVLGIDDLSI